MENVEKIESEKKSPNKILKNLDIRIGIFNLFLSLSLLSFLIIFELINVISNNIQTSDYKQSKTEIRYFNQNTNRYIPIDVTYKDNNKGEIYYLKEHVKMEYLNNFMFNKILQNIKKYSIKNKKDIKDFTDRDFEIIRIATQREIYNNDVFKAYLTNIKLVDR